MTKSEVTTLCSMAKLNKIFVWIPSSNANIIHIKFIVGPDVRFKKNKPEEWYFYTSFGKPYVEENYEYELALEVIQSCIKEDVAYRKNK